MGEERRRTREIVDHAWQSEQRLEDALADRTRAAQLQTAMTEEQERSIRRLEELLKEQSDQLRRERREHAKGLEQLKSSSDTSLNKSSLLEEQVAALRQQLHREQAELRASERAWASDRAALLTTVAAVGTKACQSR